MTFFIICLVVGAMLLLVSLFGGGEHDFDSGDIDVGGDFDSGDITDGVSLFSYRTIVIFLTTFGASGTIATHLEYPFMTALLIGVGAGILIGLFAWWLMSQAFKQQASSMVTSQDLIGKIALVNIPITLHSLGEVSLEVRGQRKAYQAKSWDGNPIKLNSSVKILEDRGVFLVVEPIN